MYNQFKQKQKTYHTESINDLNFKSRNIVYGLEIFRVCLVSLWYKLLRTVAILDLNINTTGAKTGLTSTEQLNWLSFLLSSCYPSFSFHCVVMCIVCPSFYFVGHGFVCLLAISVWPHGISNFLSKFNYLVIIWTWLFTKFSTG